MDKLKGVAKGGWKPANDPKISRETWKTDLKGMATGKKKDPYEEARNNHQSAPLTTLKDPSSFAPPPKHTGYYGNGSPSTPTSASRPSGPTGGLGSAVPSPRAKQQELEVEEPPKPPEPYRKDTSGLRTDHLPKPPIRRVDGGGTASPVRSASPALPPRTTPTLPARQSTAPPPVLPPRMNEYPDEHTAAPPPTYGEAIKTPQSPAIINEQAASRLSAAGVSVPGFGIGAQPAATTARTQAPPSVPQLNELQQRFARMNGGSSSPSSSAAPQPSPTAAAAAKKPPPPPPKKAVLQAATVNGASEPPPIPMSSKPRPGG